MPWCQCVQAVQMILEYVCQYLNTFLLALFFLLSLLDISSVGQQTPNLTRKMKKIQSKMEDDKY